MTSRFPLALVLASGLLACGSSGGGGEGGGADVAPVVVERKCQSGQIASGGGVETTVERFTGENGSFQDQCLSKTTLLAAACESYTACAPGWLCEPLDSGKVVQGEVTCPTSCDQGRCVGDCPVGGDELQFGGMSQDQWTWTVPGTSKKLLCATGPFNGCASLANGQKVTLSSDGLGYCNLGDGQIYVEVGDHHCSFYGCGWAD